MTHVARIAVVHVATLLTSRTVRCAAVCGGEVNDGMEERSDVDKQASVDRECPTYLQRHLSNIL